MMVQCLERGGKAVNGYATAVNEYDLKERNRLIITDLVSDRLRWRSRNMTFVEGSFNAAVYARACMAGSRGTGMATMAMVIALFQNTLSWIVSVFLTEIND